MMAQFRFFFWRKISFLSRVEVFFHLFYNMFRLNIIRNFQVGRSFDNLIGVTADRAELPFLETINVRERPASRAADDEVHGNVVMCFILIKIYRRIIKNYIARNSKKNSPVFCSVETHMNGSSHPNHENRLVTIVPRIRASPRRGGARRFFCIFSHLNRRTGNPVLGRRRLSQW
jgi:hypothetical protein